MKNKKAEISTGMIIGVIIVVITFGLLAIVYSQLAWSGDIDREVCKTSAMLRGTMPSEQAGSIIGAQDIISLKCQTKKICVTTNLMRKGECEDTFGTSEGKYATYRISSSDKTKAEQQIKTLLAREMADCWDMLGKGNIAIFKREFTARNNLGSVAVICSRIHFDKTITGNENGQLNMKSISGFNYYLLTHKVPNYETSYWDFLRNAYDGETMAILSGPSVTESDNTLNFLNENLDISNTKAIVFLEVRPTLAGTIIGGMAGGTIGIVGSVFAKGFGAGTMVGGGIIGGGILGDLIQLKALREKELFQNDSTSAAGIFLTNYDLDGFRKIQAKYDGQEASFEIASYA